MEETSFQLSFECCQGLRVGRSFHQHGTVNENVLESDCVALCDGTTSCRLLTDRRLLVGM